MGLLKHKHTGAIRSASGPAADFLRNKGTWEDFTPPSDAAELKGKDLAAALDEAGLPKTGSADEQRQRLADHQAAQLAAVQDVYPDGQDPAGDDVAP